MRSVLLLCSLSSVFLVGSALLHPIHQIPEWQATHAGYRGSIEMGDNYKDVPKLENRIIGGTEAIRHQFPYQVGIIVHLISGINGWCGGSLVSAHFVLTAAHCVDVSVSLIAILGAHSPLMLSEPTQQRMLIPRSNIILHHDWQATGTANDIAVFELSTPAALSPGEIAPIRLPNRRQSQLTFAGQQGTISGWGQFTDSVDALAQFLRFVRVQVITNLACRTRFPLQFQDTMMCSESTVGGICMGDNGGPMTIVEPDGETTLIGVAMANLVAACESGAPNSFTRITLFLDWIEENTDVIIDENWTENLK